MYFIIIFHFLIWPLESLKLHVACITFLLDSSGLKCLLRYEETLLEYDGDWVIQEVRLKISILGYVQNRAASQLPVLNDLGLLFLLEAGKRRNHRDSLGAFQGQQNPLIIRCQQAYKIIERRSRFQVELLGTTLNPQNHTASSVEGKALLPSQEAEDH